MSEKIYQIIKISPFDVMFKVHPLSNPSLERIIKLTKRIPRMNLPEDWALGIFLDPALYDMYKAKIFTFNQNEELVKVAIEKGVYFDEKLDFEPAQPDFSNKVLDILKKGSRDLIVKAINEYGKDFVRSVAITNVADLTQGTVQLLEQIFNVQLTIDNNVDD